MEDVIAANGKLQLPGGKQELKFQIALAGTPVTVWADDRSIHISRNGHLLRTRPSRYAASDLVKLIEQGARLAGPEPAPKALADTSGDGIVEVERTVSRDGMTGVGGKFLKLPLWLVGQEVTLRFDRDLVYVIASTGLVASMPSPVPPEKRTKLYGAHAPATEALPPPAPLPRTVWRVSPGGEVSMAGQRLKVGPSYASRDVTIVIEDHLLRVLHNNIEIGAFARENPDKPIHFKTKPTW